jgi:multisubunit Na+/H+ antiporter MnhC subunit
MSTLKSLTLAAVVVVGFATLANAATYHYRYYSQNAANTAAAANFQNQFRNTY